MFGQTLPFNTVYVRFNLEEKLLSVLLLTRSFIRKCTICK